MQAGVLWRGSRRSPSSEMKMARHVSAELFQALNDVGFSLEPNAVAHWVGEAMGRTDFVDLRKVPDVLTNAVDMLACNTAHLAKQLAARRYPGEG
jgi:hypothetical protein